MPHFPQHVPTYKGGPGTHVAMGRAFPNDIREKRGGEGWPVLHCTLLDTSIQTAPPSNRPLGLGQVPQNGEWGGEWGGGFDVVVEEEPV